MLDMKIVRQDPEKIRKMLQDRAVKFDLDLLLEFDKKRREMIINTDIPVSYTHLTLPTILLV